MKKFSRRQFLNRSFSSAALASLPITQVYGQSGGFSDYKALVCVFLLGGNDSFNMLVPRSDAEYNAYAASRQNLAIEQGVLLPINPLNSDGSSYGLHPSMGGIQPLFESGRAAFVTNVGPLLQPTTKDQYRNKSVDLPPQLFSHNNQQDQWHSLKGKTTTPTGWAGRAADLLRNNVASQQLALNVSLAGNTLFQSADETFAYTMGRTGPLRFSGLGDTGIDLERQLAFERLLEEQYSSIYERAFAEVQQRAIETADSVASALENAPTLNTEFPGSRLAQQLETVARMIAVRDDLDMRRQIFFVTTGGFDTHDFQNDNQPGLIGGVSDAIAAFYAATEELGIAGNVTTFTQSDFGRTLTSNGDGTDHAWGGNQLVTGGAVLGQRLYGTYPVLEIGNENDVNGGRMIPTTSADQYAATLARWFGVSESDLDRVAPYLGNFAIRDLGFLA